MTSVEHLFRIKKVVFLDLDGTIYMGDALIPGAKEFLNYLTDLGIIFYFLSNNSSRSKSDYVTKLSNLGISTSEEGIILSTDGVIAFLMEKKIKDLYVVGTKSMQEMFIQEGFDIASPSPSYIVLGFDTELTYEKLKAAALFLQRGVELIATHPDLVCPTPEGFIPDTGSMLALFEKATGKNPLKIFGKPNPEMIAHILKKHNITPQQAVMIGDRLYTDMELARRIKCDSILVLSGETQKEDLAQIEVQPTLVIDSIAQLIPKK
ncbi:MAG: HAD-IIA family hydrolase [Candidatus Aminicenantes bacterium]|nr:MAG: HAD-IIA family hydrolase [Candidatus Aminicenantes bacterium]